MRFKEVIPVCFSGVWEKNFRAEGDWKNSSGQNSRPAAALKCWIIFILKALAWSRGCCFWLVLFQLVSPHFAVDTAAFQQNIMATTFDYFTILQNNYLIGIDHCTQSVSHNQHCSVLPRLVHGRLNKREELVFFFQFIAINLQSRAPECFFLSECPANWWLHLTE